MSQVTNSMIEQITKWRCLECLEEFEEEVTKCPRCSQKLRVGQIAGVFEILKLTRSEVKVMCQLCGGTRFILRTNIKNMKSCGRGCKPNNIRILHVDENGYEYKCLTCGKTARCEPYTAGSEGWCCE